MPFKDRLINLRLQDRSIAGTGMQRREQGGGARKVALSPRNACFVHQSVRVTRSDTQDLIKLPDRLVQTAQTDIRKGVLSKKVGRSADQVVPLPRSKTHFVPTDLVFAPDKPDTRESCCYSAGTRVPC